MRSKLSYVGRYVEWDLSFCYTVEDIATTLRLTTKPRGRLVASSMYHIIFIKTENIAVDEMSNGENYKFTSTSTCSIFLYIKVSCIQDAVTYNIVANYSAVQY